MRNPLTSLLSLAVLTSALLLAGCKSAHVNYSLADVRPVAGSRFASQSLFVEKFKDSRYLDKKSVSFYVKESGMYGAHGGRTITGNEEYTLGLRPTPQMSDYRDIFRGVAYSPETSYYCAPDRLYWVANGPLTETREMLARHIAATRLFRSVTTSEGVDVNYVLKLDAKRFLSLKQRRPVIDVIDIFFTGFLFSSDEVISAVVDWSLVRKSDGRAVASGSARYATVEKGHCFSAKNKPFTLNNDAAEQIGKQIVRDLVRRGVANRR